MFFNGRPLKKDKKRTALAIALFSGAGMCGLLPKRTGAGVFGDLRFLPVLLADYHRLPDHGARVHQ